ncbi:MAG: nucleotidyl transferase AbiEii/AbiGii toxin family protein [Deltaproteobacteria bacterium]|nr:nucleotidyl transferase AbiEii/AbiGii toxin family protein [Deltaproteobacteria bacterium]
MDWDVVMRFLSALGDEAVEYILIGGVAMNVHGRARATQDIDIFVRPSAENVARLQRAIGRVTHDPAVAEITSQDLAGAYPAIQYVSPDGLLQVDILARLGEAFAYEDLSWEQKAFGDVAVRVATARTLFRMKRDTVRPSDHVDAQWLAREYDVEEP